MFVELTEAAHRNPYRVSRSQRKKKESYDYNFDYDTAPQGPPTEQEEDYHQHSHQTEPVGHSIGSGYSEGSGRLHATPIAE